MKLLRMAGIAACLLSSAFAQVQETIEWNVDADGFFDVPTNWKPRAPYSGARVLIDRFHGDYTVTLRQSWTGTVRSTETLRVISGKLTVDPNSALLGDLVVDGGELDTTNYVTFPGRMRFLRGTVRGLLILTGETDLYGETLFDPARLELHGRLNIKSAGPGLRPTYPWTIMDAGLLDFQADAAFSSPNYVDYKLTNRGRIRKSGGTGC